MENRIPKITLSEDRQNDLVKRLKEMIEDATAFHGTWEELHNTYLNQYLCRPKYDQKSTPWTGASNLFLPIGRIIQDGIQSQLYDAMFTNDPFLKIVGLGSEDQAAAELFNLFYGEFVFKQIIPLRSLGNEWNFMTCLDGTSAVKPRWRRDQKLTRRILPEFKPIKETVTTALAGIEATSTIITGFDESLIEEVTARQLDEPIVDLVDMATLYIAPDTINSLQPPDCPWYYQVSHLTWDQLLARKRLGYENIDDELKAKLGRRTVGELETTRRESEELAGTTLDTTEVFEFYMPLVLPTDYIDAKGKRKSQTWDSEDGIPEEYVVTYFPDTKKISRIVPLERLYPNGRRPHICNWYSKIPLMFYGQGVQSKMIHINEAANSGYNQMIDFGTLVNMPWFFYAPSLTDVLPENLSLTPGLGVPVRDPRGVVFPRFSSDQSFWLAALNQLQTYAERDGNVTDFTLGRSPERAATKTARGTIALLQQGQIAFGRLVALFVQSYEELFRTVHALYKMRAPEDVMFRVTDTGGVLRRMQMTREFLNTYEFDFQFVLNPSRIGEQQTNQILFQLMMSIPYVAENPMAVRALAKQLYDSSGKRNFDEIWPEEMLYQIQQARQQQAQQQQAQQQQALPAPQGQALMQPPEQGLGNLLGPPGEGAIQ